MAVLLYILVLFLFVYDKARILGLRVNVEEWKIKARDIVQVSCKSSLIIKKKKLRVRSYSRIFIVNVELYLFYIKSTRPYELIAMF